METEIERLRAETQRLSALVAALAEKNLRLEEALAGSAARLVALQMPVGGTNLPLINPPNAMYGSKAVEANPPTAVGGSTAKWTHPVPGVAGSIASATNPPQPIPGSTSKYPNPLHPMDGINQAGINPVTPAEAQPTGSAAARIAEAALRRAEAAAAWQLRLDRVAARMPAPPAIARALRGGPLPQLRRPQEHNLPVLLAFLCRNGTAPTPYPLLQQATGFSYTGVYKLLRAGIRAGLVRRAGWQRYELTEAGLEALEAA